MKGSAGVRVCTARAHARTAGDLHFEAAAPEKPLPLALPLLRQSVCQIAGAALELVGYESPFAEPPPGPFEAVGGRHRDLSGMRLEIPQACISGYVKPYSHARGRLPEAVLDPAAEQENAIQIAADLAISVGDLHGVDRPGLQCSRMISCYRRLDAAGDASKFDTAAAERQEPVVLFIGEAPDQPRRAVAVINLHENVDQS